MVNLYPLGPSIVGESTDFERDPNVQTCPCSPEKLSELSRRVDAGAFPGVVKVGNSFMFVNAEGFMTADRDTMAGVYATLGLRPRPDLLVDTRTIQMGTARTTSDGKTTVPAARIWRNSTFIGGYWK